MVQGKGSRFPVLYGSSVASAPFIEKIFLSPLNCTGDFLENYVNICVWIYFFLIYFERQKQCEWGRVKEGERERADRADSGLKLTKPQDHDLSQNQESTTYPAEPPRRPCVNLLLDSVFPLICVSVPIVEFHPVKSSIQVSLGFLCFHTHLRISVWISTKRACWNFYVNSLSL